MRCPVPLILTAVLVFLFISPAGAHAPLAPGQNGNLSTATLIPDPLKSTVVYGHIHEAGETAWFRMDMIRGERLLLAVNVNSEDAPVPDLIVMGPGITSSGTPPPSLVVPPGSGVLVIRGTPPVKGEYEPFTPSVIYEVASLNTTITQPGPCYAAVLATAGETDYSFVVGYKEQFTAAEWLLIPVSVIGIYLWEGQPAWAVAAPYIIVILASLGILLWQQERDGKRRGTREWMAGVAGILYLGTGASTLYQMIRALSLTGYTAMCIVTLIFALIPVVLGIWILRISWPGIPDTRGRRVSLAVAGLLGFIFWAGILAGPALALVASVIPGEPAEKGAG